MSRSLLEVGLILQMVGVALAARGIWKIRNQFNSGLGMVQVPRASILGLWHRLTNLKWSRSDRIPTATFEGRAASDMVFGGEAVSAVFRASYPDAQEERIAWLKSRMISSLCNKMSSCVEVTWSMRRSLILAPREISQSRRQGRSHYFAFATSQPVVLP
jgi:hypothetical protein